MKLVTVLFLLGLFNFVLMLGIFSAGTVIMGSGRKEVGAAVTKAATPEKTLVKARPSKKAAVTAMVSRAPAAPRPMVKPTAAPTRVVTPVKTATPEPLAGKCIIMIDGGRYDVTQFRNTHSGGNVFTCGTDVSAIFHRQHPNSFLDKMRQYRI